MQFNLLTALELFSLIFKLLFTKIFLHGSPRVFIIHERFNKIFDSLFLLILCASSYFHVLDGYSLEFFYCFRLFTLTAALSISISLLVTIFVISQLQILIFIFIAFNFFIILLKLWKDCNLVTIIFRNNSEVQIWLREKYFSRSVIFYIAFYYNFFGMAIVPIISLLTWFFSILRNINF